MHFALLINFSFVRYSAGLSPYSRQRPTYTPRTTAQLQFALCGYPMDIRWTSDTTHLSVISGIDRHVCVERRNRALSADRSVWK